MSAVTTRGVLTRMYMVGNWHSLVKEVAGRPSLEEGGLHSPLVIVSTIREVLPCV